MVCECVHSLVFSPLSKFCLYKAQATHTSSDGDPGMRLCEHT